MFICKSRYKLNRLLLLLAIAVAASIFYYVRNATYYVRNATEKYQHGSRHFKFKGTWSSESKLYDEMFLETHTLDFDSCNNKTSNSLLPENWCMDTNKIPRYLGEEQQSMVTRTSIQHYTHEGYEKCLAKKTVVFIGDSRVRYQFMHLASFLNSKKRMKCEDYLTIIDDSNITFTPDPECFLINERFRNLDWPAWYTESTNALGTTNSSSVKANLCDCYRVEDTYENRFIKRSTPYGEINLIYIATFENWMRFNEDYPPFSSYAPSPKRCATGECGDVNRTNVFEGNLNETIWNILPRLNATHAFVNRGWAEAPGGQDFSCELQEFEQNHPEIRTFMITTPPEREKTGNPSGTFDPKSPLKCNCSVFDRTTMIKNVPSDWYWDWVHVNSILNEAYNNLAVERICPIINS